LCISDQNEAKNAQWSKQTRLGLELEKPNPNPNPNPGRKARDMPKVSEFV